MTIPGSYKSHSPTETMALAGSFAVLLKPGDSVGLVGELGAGKTEFVRGIVAALRTTSEVSSPSFVRLHSYGGDPALYHADFYLAKSVDDAADYGLDELLSNGAIVLIEWADQFPQLLPRDAWWIAIEWQGGDEQERLISISRGNPPE